MKTYHSSELRSMFLKFFKDHGHAVISSASVIPETTPRCCSPPQACTRWCPT